MQRTLTLTCATALLCLALAACQPTTTAPSSDSQPSSISIDTTQATTAAATPTRAAATPAAPHTPTPAVTSCDPGPDVFVWMRSPGVPDYAQRLGSRGGADCGSTFDLMKQTAPMVPGSCTEAAWASDNPGYDENATPATRLKKVQFSVGPAC